METRRTHVIHLGLHCREPDGHGLIDYLREAVPFYQELPGVTIRLLRSVERPDHFIEVVEYSTQQAFEADQVRMTEDERMQRLLNRWRALLAEPPTVEHYADISSTIV